MTEEIDPKELSTLEGLLLHNIHTLEALINLLEKKGILDKKELQEESEKIRQEHSCYLKK
jgi:hypothetical protein